MVYRNRKTVGEGVGKRERGERKVKYFHCKYVLPSLLSEGFRKKKRRKKTIKLEKLATGENGKKEEKVSR